MQLQFSKTFLFKLLNCSLQSKWGSGVDIFFKPSNKHWLEIMIQNWYKIKDIKRCQGKSSLHDSKKTNTKASGRNYEPLKRTHIRKSCLETTTYGSCSWVKAFFKVQLEDQYEVNVAMWLAQRRLGEKRLFTILKYIYSKIYLPYHLEKKREPPK